MADIVSGITSAWSNFYNNLPQLSQLLPHTKEVEKLIIREVQMIGTPPSARTFVRLAGISGAIAVSLGAYGSHVFRHKEMDPQIKETFEIANKYHFLHTLALLGCPLTRNPAVVGTLLSTGMVLFCGSCYYHSITGNMAIRKVTPFGGILLIVAWVAMVF